MKKIITILLIATLSFSSSFAYTKTELDSEKNTYKKVLINKIGTKLEKVSEDKLEIILFLIDDLIEKYNNNEKLSDSKKLKKVSILIAFKEIINEKLEDDFSDINNILNKVNKNYGPIFLITDSRCGEKCNLSPINSQLKNIPSLKNADIIELDFGEEQAKNLLKTTGINKLPAAIFPNNNIYELSNYLNKTENKSYSLELGGTFNPYDKRSQKGFQVLDKKIIEKIKSDSYIKGNKNSKILWLEYSDMECPFCAKLHNSGTYEELEKEYGTEFSYSLQHFPLDFHKNALLGSEALECLAKQNGSKSFYELGHIIFSNKNSDLDFIIEKSVELGANKHKLEDCIENKEFEEKIKSQQTFGTKTFGITGTPGNVLINTETGEYEVISGAYPTANFIKIIDKLLK